MKKLPIVINRKNFTYTLKWRDEEYAIYEQVFNQNNQIQAFEAFKIRKQTGRDVKMFDKIVHFEEAELYPHDNDFGITAFSCNTYERAIERINKMKLAEMEGVK